MYSNADFHYMIPCPSCNQIVELGGSGDAGELKATCKCGISITGQADLALKKLIITNEE